MVRTLRTLFSSTLVFGLLMLFIGMGILAGTSCSSAKGCFATVFFADIGLETAISTPAAVDGGILGMDFPTLARALNEAGIYFLIIALIALLALEVTEVHYLKLLLRGR